jgi:hypothetical protein
MTPNASQAAAEEFVLRRIHRNHVDAGPPPVVGFTAFRPTLEDTNGLSVYRDQFISPREVAASGRKPDDYYVARLPVQALHDLGLTVVVDEQTEGPAGHALLPALSLDACQKDKARLREIQVRLAELASQHVVHYPDKPERLP